LVRKLGWQVGPDSLAIEFGTLRPAPTMGATCRFTYDKKNREAMKKNPVAMIAIGALIIIVGLTMMFTSGAPKADTALVLQCQTKLRAQGMDASFVKQCDETAFATAVTATDANAAAQAISAANSREIGGNSIALFIMGFGAVILAVGGYGFVRRSRLA
jgi:hypothetical protein